MTKVIKKYTCPKRIAPHAAQYLHSMVPADIRLIHTFDITDGEAIHRNIRMLALNYNQLVLEELD